MSVARNRIAVYPGTFDPITSGHVDLVDRVAPLFDRLIVGVAKSPAKRPALQLHLRVDLARDALAHHGNVEVRGFASLLAHFVAARTEEHTSELPSLMRISFAALCLTKQCTVA